MEAAEVGSDIISMCWLREVKSVAHGCTVRPPVTKAPTAVCKVRREEVLGGHQSLRGQRKEKSGENLRKSCVSDRKEINIVPNQRVSEVGKVFTARDSRTIMSVMGFEEGTSVNGLMRTETRFLSGVGGGEEVRAMIPSSRRLT